jgi:hypothetical protein
MATIITFGKKLHQNTDFIHDTAFHLGMEYPLHYEANTQRSDVLRRQHGTHHEH